MLYNSLVTYGKLQGLFFAWIVHRERVATFYGGGQVSEETQLSRDLHKQSGHKSWLSGAHSLVLFLLLMMTLLEILWEEREFIFLLYPQCAWWAFICLAAQEEFCIINDFNAISGTRVQKMYGCLGKMSPWTQGVLLSCLGAPSMKFHFK